MDDIELVEKARAFALRKHRGKKRPNKAREDYSVHILEVGELVRLAGGDAVTQAMGLLHDTVEDTKTTVAEIRVRFGEEVADGVDGLTDPPEYKGMPTLERKTLQAERLRGKGARVLLCKEADGTSNLRSVAKDPPKKWDRQKCLDYIEGVRRVSVHCLGISAYMDAEFHAAYAAAMASVDAHYPT